MVHASDISFLARPSKARITQAYLLFEEFFNQGDEEAARGLPISFLCDRTTTNVAKSQSGFLKFAPLPLFKMIVSLSPSKAPIVDRLLEAADEMDALVETEELLRSYEKKPGLGSLDDSWI